MTESNSVESENQRKKLNLTDIEIDNRNDEKVLLNARFGLFSLKLRSENHAMDLIGSSGVQNDTINDKNRTNDGDKSINDNPDKFITISNDKRKNSYVIILIIITT